MREEGLASPVAVAEVEMMRSEAGTGKMMSMYDLISSIKTLRKDLAKVRKLRFEV